MSRTGASAVEPVGMVTVGGSARAGKRRARGTFVQGLYVALFVAFMLAPLVVVIGASFEPKALLRFPPHGFSLHWYRMALESNFVSAARVSAIVAVLATIGALVLGVPAAWALARFSFRGKAAVSNLLSSSLLVPQLVIGIALLQIFIVFGLGASVLTLTLGHIVITLPYVARIVYAAVLGLDASIEEAAANLGANRLRVYTTVVLPMIRPALYSSTLFAFLISFDNAVISLFLVAGTTTTLPIAMYTYVQYNLDPTIAAVSSLLMALSVLAMYLASKLAPLDRIGTRASGQMNLANGQSVLHAVDVRDLRVWYNDTQVLRSINLRVMPGEIVSLLGPSGCGKTTTLRAIAGFVTPDAGEVYLAGRDVTAMPPHRREIGMVFQGYALFPHLSVFDNVAYGLRMRKVSRPQIAQRVMEALSLVKLANFAQRRPKQLSGGQQQRVAIARALVVQPKVLLLDEPLSNLDAKLRQEMRIELRRLLKSTGAASVFVTHDQEEAMVLSDRIVLMNGGEIVQEGAPREIYQEPRTLFAAAFVGQANFLQGTVSTTSEAGHTEVTVGKITLRGVACGELRRGMPAMLVVKHERVRAISSEPASSCNVVDCTFEIANFVGAHVQLHCVFGGQPFVCLISAPRRQEPLAPGAMVRLAWEEADTLIFPVPEN